MDEAFMDEIDFSDGERAADWLGDALINNLKDKPFFISRGKTVIDPLPKKCLHNQCSECRGSGLKKDGTPCIHFISCNCKNCKPV